MKHWSVRRELTGEELACLRTEDSTVRIEFGEPGLCALPIPDPELPVHVEDQVRAELRDLAVRDRAAAPSPDEVLERMAANGLIDPERDTPTSG